MALHRCAACGSPNVMTDIQKEGYDYVKGAIGTVVLGTGGAVAGLDGKKTTVYKCPDCGTTLSYCMPEELKMVIDMGVASKEMREHLQLNGAPVDWTSLTQKYRNIGESQPSAGERMANEWREAAVVNKAQATKAEFDAAVDCIVETWRKFGYYGRRKGITDYYCAEKPYTLEEHTNYQNAVAIFIENCSQYISPNSNLHIKYRGLDPHIDISSLFREYLLAQYMNRTRKHGLSLIYSYSDKCGMRQSNDDMDRMIGNDPFLTEFIHRYADGGALLITNKNAMKDGCYSDVFFSDDTIVGHHYGTCRTSISDVPVFFWFPKFLVKNRKLFAHYNENYPDIEYAYECSCCYIGDEAREIIENYCHATSVDVQEVDSAFSEVAKQRREIAKQVDEIKQQNRSIKAEVEKKQAELTPLLRPRLFGRKQAEAEAAALREQIAELKKEMEENAQKEGPLSKEYTTATLKTHDLLEKFDFFTVWAEQKES